MNRNTVKAGLFLKFAMVGSVISSIPIAGYAFFEGKSSGILAAAAIVFWIGLLIEQICLWNANAARKRDLKENPPKRKSRQRIGIFEFASTKEGVIADGAVLLSVLGLIVCKIFFKNSILEFEFLFLFVLSFRLHCILNGRNFIYTQKNKQRSKKRHAKHN